MASLSSYQYPAPAHSFVVHLFQSGDKVMGFVREIGEEDDPDAPYPTEEVPARKALELAIGRASEKAGARVYVDLEPGLTWESEWGALDE